MIAVTLIATAATIYTVSSLMNYRQGAQDHNDTRVQLEMLLAKISDAEIEQRGYLLTADAEYLAPYHLATQKISDQLTVILEHTPGTASRGDLATLKQLVNQKLQDLDRSIALRQSGDFTGSMQNVESGADKALIDKIRFTDMKVQNAETARLAVDRTSITDLAALARDISVVSLLATLGLSLLVYWVYVKAIQSERRLDRAKDEFVSLASHQLRTPATGIKSILSTLVAGDFGPLNERQAYFMKRALESNERELGIIEELLNVAKADAGRLVLHASEFELDALINSIAEEQREAIALKKQDLTIRRPTHSVRVVADEEKLYMAIGNLLDNARKYTPESGKLSISVSKRHGSAQIEVADSGIGIEPEEINHIFDRFHRASEAMASNVEGAGLGLYLASRIAQLHQGTIEVISNRGKGTKFVMILPQGELHAAEDSASRG